LSAGSIRFSRSAPLSQNVELRAVCGGLPTQLHHYLIVENAPKVQRQTLRQKYRRWSGRRPELEASCPRPRAPVGSGRSYHACRLGASASTDIVWPA